jgi:2-aminobenzoate-CoA ligase
MDEYRGASTHQARLWSDLIADNLPPRELWPDYRYDLPELRYPETLNLACELLARSRVTPQKAAFHFHHTHVSYETLSRRTMALAASMAGIGAGPGDRIGLSLPNCPDFAAAWLATQWIGAVCVQMPTIYRRSEIARIVNNSGTSVIVCGPGSIPTIEAARHDFQAHVALVVVGPYQKDSLPSDRKIVFVDELSSPTLDPSAPYASRRDQPALITYIASEEGVLRGVVHSPAEILASADTYARHVLNLTSSDICIGITSLAWAFGFGGLLTFPLRMGATTALPDSPMQLIRAIEESRATVLFGVPTMYRMLLDHRDLDRCDLRSLRCCISAAEPLPPDVIHEWRRHTGLDIIDGLGTTEMTHVFISAKPGAVRSGCIGTIVPGYEARIVDSSMRDVPDGTPGLLAVRGPTGARYWRDPDMQRRTVRDGWTLSGDVCTRHSDGWFEHIRRADAIIVSAGYKISPREVERVLETHPDVRWARVFSAPHPIRGATVKSTVARATRADATTLRTELQQMLQSELAPFKWPREIEVV